MHPEYSIDLGSLWTLSSHGAFLRVLHVAKSNPAEMETNQHSKRHQNGGPILKLLQIPNTIAGVNKPLVVYSTDVIAHEK